MVPFDVGFELIAEVPDGGEDRVRGRLTETAERAVLDSVAQLFEFLDVALFALAFDDAVEDLEHPLRAEAAVDTFTAALLGGEVQEKLRHVDHTGGLVHDDHTAGTHDGTGGAELGVVDDGVELLRRDTSAGGTAQLDGFEGHVVLDAAADVEDDVAERGAHGDLDEAASFDLTGKGEDLGALGLFGAHGREGRAAVVDDPGDVRVRLDVVDVGRFLPVAGLGRERRFQAGHAALAFEGLDEGGLFAADEGAGTGLDAKGAGEVGT